MKYSSIFLIGPMGAGKTSVGRKLAKLTNRKFIDTDQLIAYQQQRSVADIINSCGEEYFRMLEQQAISTAMRENNIVLATGGGSVLSAHLRNLLPQYGVIYYLQVSPTNQVSRLDKDQSRPLLPRDQRLQFFTQMLENRGCLYTEIADMIINTDDKSVDQIVQQISSLVLEYADYQ